MKGKLYVDGYDAYKTWRIYVMDNGYKTAIQYPSLKEPDSNDWQEEDGEEVDLEAPVLDTRDVSLTFAIRGQLNRYQAFVEMLADGAYHTFNMEAIGRTYKLRLVSQSNRVFASTFGYETLKFADDFPLMDYTYVAPASSVPEDDAYLIDDVPTTDYGMRVLQGSFAEVLKTAAVKENLLRDLDSLAGVIYDNDTVVYQAKDVKLTCLMRAETLEELWQNYDALLYNLTQPDERMLYVTELEQEFPFYYVSSSVSEFYAEDRIWLKFTLTIRFTHDFRIDADGMILVTEDGIPVITEDGVYYIDLEPDVYAYPSMRLVNNRQTLRLASDGTLRFND